MAETKHTATSPVPLKEASIHAVVIRCGCGDPANIHPGEPCPTPRTTEDRGTVSYYHRNPLRRLAWAAKQGWKEGRS